MLVDISRLEEFFLPSIALFSASAALFMACVLMC